MSEANFSSRVEGSSSRVTARERRMKTIQDEINIIRAEMTLLQGINLASMSYSPERIKLLMTLFQQQVDELEDLDPGNISKAELDEMIKSFAHQRRLLA